MSGVGKSNSSKFRSALKRIVQEIMDYGLGLTNLFTSSNLESDNVQYLKKILQTRVQQSELNISNKFLVFDYAGVLRLLLQDIKEPIIPTNVGLSLCDAVTSSDANKLQQIKEIILDLPKKSLRATQPLLFLFQHIYFNKETNMVELQTINELLQPLFLCNNEEKFKKHINNIGTTIEFLINNYLDLFPIKYEYGSNKLSNISKKLYKHSGSVQNITNGLEEEFWSSDLDGNVLVWDCNLMKVKSSVKLTHPVSTMKLIDENMWCVGGKFITVVDARSTEIIKSWKELCCCISPGPEETIWFGGNHISVYNSNFEQTQLINLLIHDDKNDIVYCNCITLVDKHIWSGFTDGTIRIYDINGEEIRILDRAHTKVVNDLLWIGDYVWSCSDDCSIAIWDKSDFSFVTRITRHTSKVTNLSLFNTSHVISCSLKSAIIWDGIEGGFVGEFAKFHSNMINNIMFYFTPKGTWQSWSSSDDSSICISNLNIQNWFVDYSESKKDTVEATPRDGDPNQNNNNNNNNNNIIELDEEDTEESYVSINKDPTSLTSSFSIPKDIQRTLNLPATHLIDNEELKIDFSRSLGSGILGTVYRGIWRHQKVAVKLINPRLLHTEDEVADQLAKFIYVLLNVNHPNIILFMGFSYGPRGVYLVFEYMEEGSLLDIINSQRKVDIVDRLKIAKGVAQALTWLHQVEPPISHLNLKLSNLLVDSHFRVKLSDFGVVEMLKKVKFPTVNDGEFIHISPEQVLNNSTSLLSDQYSFGILLWQLWSFKQASIPNVKTTSQLEEFYNKKQKLPLPDGIPSKLLEIINGCCSYEAEKRPSFSEIVEKFDGVVIDCIIWDPEGRQFWKSYFPEQTEVLWVRFLASFQIHQKAYCVVSDPKIQCLKALLDENDTGVVTIQKFGELLRWFGPFSQLGLLDRVANLLSEPWFNGDLSASAAEKILTSKKKRKTGTFLVRFSSSDPGCFTISVYLSPNVKHHKVIHRPGGSYSVNSNSKYETLQELVAKSKNSLSLKYPCPYHKYAFIFRPPVSSGYTPVFT